ncbi:hypothetical protein N566_17360, partial [Streptomycetaceae bacterium MP113-05]
EAAELLGPTAGDGGVLLFLSPDCRTCTGVLAEARASAAHGGGPALTALYAGPAPEGAEEVGAAVPVHAGRDDLFAAYDAVATPFAVAVDGTGRVLRATPLGSAAALPEMLDETFPSRLRSTQ